MKRGSFRLRDARTAATLGRGIAVALGLTAAALRLHAAPGEISASDPHFRYGGRLDDRNPRSPVLVWEASTVAIDFTGSRAELRFSGTGGQVFLDVSVDGRRSVLPLRPGVGRQAISLALTGSGRHHLELFKRSEASAGTTHFDGISIDAAGRVFSPAATGPRLRLEIYGDSITAGACAEDGDKDQWTDRRTHNAADSWAALTAAAFAADYRNLSVSGIGLSTGYDDVVERQVWDRIYPTADAPRADLRRWVPDVVLVLLGDNDDACPRDNKLPFPADFTATYTAQIRSLRAAYPEAHIVLLNGGMWAGIHSEPLIKGWTAAVNGLEAQDKAISHFVFAHWTSLHPRVSDHRILAGELIPWLRRQPFMAAAPAVSR